MLAFFYSSVLAHLSKCTCSGFRGYGGGYGYSDAGWPPTASLCQNEVIKDFIERSHPWASLSPSV